MAEWLDEYLKLDSRLREQLACLQDRFYNNDRVLRNYRSALDSLHQRAIHSVGMNGTNNSNGTKNKENNPFTTSSTRRREELGSILFRMAILKSQTPMDVIIPSNLSGIYPYSIKSHPPIKLVKIVKTGKHAKVVEGRIDDRKVIVKWYKSGRRDITYETSIYQRLKEVGCPTAWYSKSYRMWGYPVLVLEHLHPLSRQDNEYQMGIDVIHQLYYIHQFGVHCDIKPGNIMKRVDGDSLTYLLIDFGGLTLEKHNLGGYRRWIWSPKWTTQPEHEPNQQTCPMFDFLELAVTMRAIQIWRENNETSEGNKDPHKGYRGKLKKYVQYVKNINRLTPDNRDYEELIRILSE